MGTGEVESRDRVMPGFLKRVWTCPENSREVSEGLFNRVWCDCFNKE